MYLVETDDGTWFAIPLRSRMAHPFGFKTTDEDGLDYSKAIPIFDESYIDESRTAYIRKDELPVIRRNRHRIKNGMARYVERYKRARTKMHIRANRSLVEKSTLQYFERELGITDPEDVTS